MVQDGGTTDGNQDVKVRLRGYQEEVLQKSLERNVIVAMPTGSEDICHVKQIVYRCH